MLTRKIRTGIVFSLILALVVVTAITFYADAPRMIAALAEFRWVYLPLILGCTLFNYLVRFVKWQYYLRCLKIELPWVKSLLIFLAGLSMVLTPGKVGEILKSYLLKRETGAAISRTSSIIAAERLTDGIAMLGLTATGLFLYRVGWELLLILLVASLACVILIQNRSLALGLLRFGERLPVVSRIAHLVRAFYESAYTLLQWRSLLLAIANGVVSWAGECAALYFVYVGLGMEGNLDLFLKSTFILAASSLIGSATGIPGGLGSADGSMLGLSRLLVSTSAALAGAATLLIRLCTLWFGLLVGVIALLTYRFIERDKHWGEWDHKNDILPFSQVSESALLAEKAPASASTGEKIV